MQLRTFLCVRGEAPLSVIAVGQDVPQSCGATRIDLFHDDERHALGGAVDRALLLDAFVRYGIQATGAVGSILRPLVTVVGVDSLRPVLRGYERAVLLRALMNAGAAAVTFQ